MKNFFSCVSLLLLFAACKKERIDSSRVKTFSLTSAVNGATYDIRVALPKNYAPGQTYNTLYVLDPKTDFDLVARECEKLAGGNKPEVLVVGIGGGNNRIHDYLPVPYRNGGGGADQFIRFVRDELVPKIETDFRAATTRASRGMIGHSAGGLCVAYCFTNYNELFGRYIALSPSLWLGDQIVLKNEKATREAHKAGSGAMFLAVGEMEEEVMRPPIEAFRQIMLKHYPGYAFQYNLASGLDHLGSKKTNIRNGLGFYFTQL